MSFSSRCALEKQSQMRIGGIWNTAVYKFTIWFGLSSACSCVRQHKRVNSCIGDAEILERFFPAQLFRGCVFQFGIRSIWHCHSQPCGRYLASSQYTCPYKWRIWTNCPLETQIRPLARCCPSFHSAHRTGEMYHGSRRQSSPQETMGCWVTEAASSEMTFNRLKSCTEIGVSLGL